MNDQNHRKRVIYFSLTIAVVLIGLYFVYRALLPESRPEAPLEGGVTGTSGRLPLGDETRDGSTPPGPGDGSTTRAREEQRLLQISDFPVIGPGLNKDQTKVLYYKKDGGHLYSSDLRGTDKEKLSVLTIIGLVGAEWNRSGEAAAVFSIDRETLTSLIYKGTTTYALPQNITSASWSPDGKTFAYLAKKEGLTELTTTDATAGGRRMIFTTSLGDADVEWVTSDLFTFLTAPSGFAEGHLFTYSRSSGLFTKIIGPFFGLTAKWSPDGSRVLVGTTTANGRNPALTVYDKTGKFLFEITLKTIADKCAFASPDEIYCAVPREHPPLSTWPDEYYRGELNTIDKIYSIDLKTKVIKEILNEGSLDVSDLTITKARDYLLFVNRFDGTLWSLKLK